MDSEALNEGAQWERPVLNRWAQKRKRSASFHSLTFNVLVRLAGFEPTTPWFVAKYSIQLSYSR
jgi:hypothetical protein